MAKDSGDHKPSRSPEARALDALIYESKAESKEPVVDWSKIEAKVMAAVNEEAPRFVARESARMRALRAGAVILAAAAAVALLLRSSSQQRSEDDKTASTGVSSQTPASSLVGVTGEVRIGSNAAEPGFVLHANDSITTTTPNARATFERTRKVAWLVEENAHVRVKSAGETLILGLENGAIEAQVVPVPVGEAFAVDVTSSTGSLVRVAVHGTHLRVTRVPNTNRVMVDLTEGVVSIGVPPRAGVTYGTLVNAPAHVELDASDLASIRVDHNLNAVRPAIALNPFGTVEASSSPTGPQKLALAPAAKENALVPAPSPLLGDSQTPPRVANGGAPSTPREPGAIDRSPKDDKPTPAKAAHPEGAAPPRDAIAAAVRDCAVAARSRSGARSGNDVTHVTVTSTLKLRVSSGGVVETAQFSPPLPAEIQSCAAQVIYKTKLESETGLVTIPIEFEFSR